MAETSRSRVTITLGRNRQVVKRAGDALDDRFFPNSHPSVGSKRSVMDRLGSNVDSAAQFNSKRRRQDGSRSSASNVIDDVSLDKDDLRFKIIRKSQKKDVDLRNMLSRPAHSSTTSLGTRQHLPQLEDTRQKFTGLRDDRQQISEARTSRPLLTEPRNGRQYLSELTDDKHLMQPKESRHLRPESNGSIIFGQIPSARRMDALPNVDPLRNSYSPWTLDSLRRRSPGSSRGLSLPRRNEERERRPLLKAYDESRATSYISKDTSEHSRPTKTACYGAKTAQAAGPAKSIVPLRAPLPPSVGLVQKSSNAVGDHTSVDSFLHSLGLDKYAIYFKAEEVDMYALRQMGDTDLKELGIPMGPRKKILLTLLARSKRQI